MPEISQRGFEMPASPIRKLAPLSDAAKARGTKVYHLNIGQPDLPSPRAALEAIRNIDRTTLTTVSQLNVFDILQNRTLLTTRAGLEKILA